MYCISPGVKSVWVLSSTTNARVDNGAGVARGDLRAIGAPSIDDREQLRTPPDFYPAGKVCRDLQCEEGVLVINSSPQLLFAADHHDTRKRSCSRESLH